MFRNLAERFVGVGDLDDPLTRERHVALRWCRRGNLSAAYRYIDFKSRRTKFAPTVGRINLYKDFVPLARQRCVEVAAPYKSRGNKLCRFH